jgi:hypothetical protein
LNNFLKYRLHNVVYFYFFSSDDEIQSKASQLDGNYKECFELCAKMTQRLSHERPDCEEIHKRKNLWALNKEELEFSDKLEDIIASIERENEFTIYSMLRSLINLIKNSSFDSS